jgi:hypothetical protein
MLSGLSRASRIRCTAHVAQQGLLIRRRLNVIVSTTATPERLIDECLKVRSSVQALNDKYRGPLEKSAQKNTLLPFVFLLGNHSSGKSSFVNYVCQRKVQTAGVAPTDDCFTLIIPGAADADRDGPALVGDPDMGFSGLRVFGPQLIHHTQLKVRCDIAIKNFCIVDTPGMIDSPFGLAGRGKGSSSDRGYDFEGVCKWFAERADVILLFFDPDKPGTTGETLSILTNSLVGQDYKLHIILNKADQFRKIHDFARAYGSLCWNLSKVIQRKDLPRIYTMCLPTNFQAPASGDQSDEGRSLGQGLIDLEAAREEVVAEVLNAPKRRVDNEVSRLSDAVAVLQMHCQIIQDVGKRYRAARLRARLSEASAAVVAVGVPATMVTLGITSIKLVGAAAAVGAVVTGGLHLFNSRSLDAYAQELITPDALEGTYKRIYARRIAERDEFTASLWKRVFGHIQLGITAAELQALGKIQPSELEELEKVLDVEVPKLRRLAAPVFNR